MAAAATLRYFPEPATNPTKPAMQEAPTMLSLRRFRGLKTASAPSLTLASTVLMVSLRSRRAPSSSSSICAICSSSTVMTIPQRSADYVTQRIAHRYLPDQSKQRDPVARPHPATKNKPGRRRDREGYHRLFLDQLGQRAILGARLRIAPARRISVCCRLIHKRPQLEIRRITCATANPTANATPSASHGSRSTSSRTLTSPIPLS